MPLLPFLGAVLQIRAVAGRFDDEVDEFGHLEAGGLIAQLHDESTECGERGLLPLWDVRNLLGPQQRLRRHELVRTRERHQPRSRLVTDTARRCVDDAREPDAVERVPDDPEIGERVLDLAPLIEGHAADDLISEPEPAEHVLDRA